MTTPPSETLATAVTAVVVTYNSANVIEACLSALPPEIRVLVVDNNSTDTCLDLAQKIRPEVEIIQMGRNAGYGSAANAGFAKIVTPYGLLVNPDAEVSAGALTILLDALDTDQSAAIAVPHLVRADGTPERSFDASLAVREEWPKERRHSLTLADGPCCADFLSGAVMLIRLTPFHAIRGFDEGLFLYYEDDDLCWRMRGAGHSLLVAPAAICRHLSGHSSTDQGSLSPFKEEAITWSRLLFTAKTLGCEEAERRAHLILNKAKPRAFFYRLLGRRKRAVIQQARIDAVQRFLKEAPHKKA